MAASSMTSSWNRVARWVSSIATAAGTIRSSLELPNCAASSTSIARNLLPPAAIRCMDASVSSGSLACVVSRRADSTRARPSRTSASTAVSGRSTGTAVITRAPSPRYAPRERTLPGPYRQSPPVPRVPVYEPCPQVSVYEELARGLAGEAEHRLGHDAEDQRRRGANPHRGPRVHARDHHRSPASDGLAEVHQHDDPDVEERRDRAAQHADDHQRHRPAG